MGKETERIYTFTDKELERLVQISARESIKAYISETEKIESNRHKREMSDLLQRYREIKATLRNTEGISSESDKKRPENERLIARIQLQAVKLDDDTYMVQEFDNELVFMGELWSGCKYPDEVLDWMKSNYEIESCLTAEVYRSSLGDCTNNGISSYARELYILDAQKGPFEPDDIRQCVYIEKREIMGQEYVDCKPAYCRKRWYMAGGNILYTSDSRFKQITGISYPIAIHDRYEGR